MTFMPTTINLPWGQERKQHQPHLQNQGIHRMTDEPACDKMMLALTWAHAEQPAGLRSLPPVTLTNTSMTCGADDVKVEPSSRACFGVAAELLLHPPHWDQTALGRRRGNWQEVQHRRQLLHQLSGDAARRRMAHVSSAPTLGGIVGQCLSVGS